MQRLQIVRRATVRWAIQADVRHYGRSPPGERLIDAAPRGHWKTTPFVAGLRSSGLIEPVFTKLKALLREAAAGTGRGLWMTIGQALDEVPLSECHHYIANRGYKLA